MPTCQLEVTQTCQRHPCITSGWCTHTGVSSRHHPEVPALNCKPEPGPKCSQNAWEGRVHKPHSWFKAETDWTPPSPDFSSGPGLCPSLLRAIMPARKQCIKTGNTQTLSFKMHAVFPWITIVCFQWHLQVMVLKWQRHWANWLSAKEWCLDAIPTPHAHSRLGWLCLQSAYFLWNHGCGHFALDFQLPEVPEWDAASITLIVSCWDFCSHCVCVFYIV